MNKYLWTIGGGWSEASSIEDLKAFYQSSGNMQNSFIAVEVDRMGNKVNITDRIKPITRPTETKKTTSQKKWWEFWK